MFLLFYFPSPVPPPPLRPSPFLLCSSSSSSLFLFHRMKETSRKNNVFAQFRKTDRDRQKLIDTVIKQLRNLIAQHHT